MRIGLYARHHASDTIDSLQQLVAALEAHDVEICLDTTMMEAIKDKVAFEKTPIVFEEQEFARINADFLFSIGGDGTLLSSVHLIGNSGVPVVGINFGHLGFLTTINKWDLENFISDLIAGNYSIEKRSLLHVSFPGTETYVLNETYVHRKVDAPLLKANLFVDDEFVATYDGDGIIVATPTGSTAYSLGCGGPIMTPNSHCFSVTPIGAHTLTLRPIIVPDTAKIRIVIGMDNDKYVVGMDSRTMMLHGETEILLSREEFTVSLVRMNHQSFFTAMHEKMMWGTGGRS